jgi:hypothetical protein
MQPWVPASLVFFVYIAVGALLRIGLSRRARVRAVIAAAGGIGLTAFAAQTTGFWLRDVILPPLLLVVGYWTSGLLWVGPMATAERYLACFDQRLRIPELAARLPRLVTEFLELAYVAVYPLIPIAFFLHLTSAPAPDAGRFWTVILVTDYICFGMLLWLQTRPPRVVEAGVPYASSLRIVNVTLLSRASIGANTLPSGHAAEALAVALLLSNAPHAIATSMAVCAIAISAAAVLGRYHYFLDALTGWMVAAVVWLVV